MEKMGRGVIALDRGAPGRVDLGGHGVPRRDAPGFDDERGRRSDRRPGGRYPRRERAPLPTRSTPCPRPVLRPRRKTASPRARSRRARPRRAREPSRRSASRAATTLTPSSVALSKPVERRLGVRGQRAPRALRFFLLAPLPRGLGALALLFELDVEPVGVEDDARARRRRPAPGRAEARRCRRGGTARRREAAWIRRELAQRLVEKGQPRRDRLSEALLLAARDFEDGALRTDDLGVDLPQGLDDDRGDVARGTVPRVRACVRAGSRGGARGAGRSRACRSRERRRRRRGSTGRGRDRR